jgi:ATP-binding cassette subfamily G (WHITE) protein 2
MCNGKSVYHGSSKEILSYFSEQGYQCELHDNPADFVLDVLIDVSEDENNLEKLYISYKKSSMYTTTMNNINQQLHGNDVEKLISEQKSVMKRSLSREIYYLSTRTLINVIRNPELFMSQIVVAIILSLLAGLVFYDMKKTIDPGIPNRFGGIFFIVVSQSFSAVTSLEPLLNDRVLFIHVNYNNKNKKKSIIFLVGEC